MDAVSPLPARGAVFFDPRDDSRVLRVSHHEELGVFVLSLWRDDTCLGTFRLAVDEAPRLLHTMVSSLTAPQAGEDSAIA